MPMLPEFVTMPFSPILMPERRIVIPNSVNSYIVDEMLRHLNEGDDVRIAFGGNSMLPLIDGRSDVIQLEPLPSDVHVGDICLFFFEGHCVIHRLMRINGDEFIFRGDNCMRHEHVRRSDVVARLKAVEHSNGTIDLCDSPSWRRRSRCVVLRRSLINAVRRCFSRRQRRWQRWLYFFLLLILMWAPLGFVGLPLNNFVFGIRLDHLIHASVYIPCAFFLMDFPFATMRGRGRRRNLWLASVAIGITTEFVQYLLPYRGFDINDLVANVLGVTVGWIIIRMSKK